MFSVRGLPTCLRWVPESALLQQESRRLERWQFASVYRVGDAGLSPMTPAFGHAVADSLGLAARNNVHTRLPRTLGPEVRLPRLALSGLQSVSLASATAATCELTPSFWRIDLICDRTVDMATHDSFAISSADRPLMISPRTSPSRRVRKSNGVVRPNEARASVSRS